ncbi:uncharacterized protein LOC112596621 [Melanaphis sacchari]|uniref:uncharacterized protein LOC112596621 n=1 Tax=Melanaphis sacchari TaxID=742174 RepID=UPI000DC13C85|nr:uncharacterized protein LOC112596621 [Melanaphis sacchari]
MLVELSTIFLTIIVPIGMLALFLLKADPAERENDGDIDADLWPTALSSRWSRLQLYKNEDDVAKNVQTVTVSKDTIYAMMQRGVNALNAKEVKTDEEGHAIDDSVDDQWARKCMERMCAELDLHHPNVISLILLANDYCDTLEKMMDEFENELCRYNKTLALLTENRMDIEKEIIKKSYQCKQQGADEKIMAIVNNESSPHHWKPIPVPVRHTIVKASRADDDFLTIFEQFKKAQEENRK